MLESECVANKGHFVTSVPIFKCSDCVPPCEECTETESKCTRCADDSNYYL